MPRTDHGEWHIGDATPVDLDSEITEGTLQLPPAAAYQAAVSAQGQLAASGEYLTKPEYLTKAQAGAIVQLDPKTIERLIGRGELRAYKLAGKIRIRPDDLNEWVDKNAINPSVHDI